MDQNDRVGVSSRIYDFVHCMPGRAISNLIFALGALEDRLAARERSAIEDHAIKRTAQEVLEKIGAAREEEPGYEKHYIPLQRAIKKLLR